MTLKSAAEDKRVLIAFCVAVIAVPNPILKGIAAAAALACILISYFNYFREEHERDFTDSIRDDAIASRLYGALRNRDGEQIEKICRALEEYADSPGQARPCLDGGFWMLQTGDGDQAVPDIRAILAHPSEADEAPVQRLRRFAMDLRLNRNGALERAIMILEQHPVPNCSLSGEAMHASRLRPDRRAEMI